MVRVHLLQPSPRVSKRLSPVDFTLTNIITNTEKNDISDQDFHLILHVVFSIPVSCLVPFLSFDSFHIHVALHLMLHAISFLPSIVFCEMLLFESRL